MGHLLAITGAGLQRMQVSAMNMNELDSKIVLIIDDSEDICEAVSDILSEIGIPVLTAHDGQRGLDLYLEHREAVGVVLLDMVLPILTGTEVLKELRLLTPNLPVVISSGYGDSAMSGHANDPYLSFLSKPFSFDDLVAKVEAAVQ